MQMPISERWRSEEGLGNALAIQAEHSGLFNAIAEFDRLGHRVLARVSQRDAVDTYDELIAIPVLRRSVTLFAGFRQLVEGASVEPAKLLARALFELFVYLRFMVFGARRGSQTRYPDTSSQSGRERRARYWRAQGLRRFIYRAQALLDHQLGRREAVPLSDRRELRAAIETAREELEENLPTENTAFGPLGVDAEPPQGRRYYDNLRWYSFAFPNPQLVRSLYQLSKRLRLLDQYEFLYRPFSGLVHPDDVHRDVVVSEGRAEILHPHLVEGFPMLTWWAIAWQQDILAIFCRTYQPGSFGDVRDIALAHSPALSSVSSDTGVAFY